MKIFLLKKQFVSIFLLLISINLYCQIQFDTTYVQLFNKKYTARIWSVSKNFSFAIKPIYYYSEIKKIFYIPRDAYFTGVGLTRKNFGINLFFSTTYSPSNKDKYNIPNNKDFKLNMYKRHVEGNLYYRKYYGFFINDAYSFLNLKKNLSEINFRKDISVENFGGELFYIFNHQKYSLHATYKQTEHQKKSAGSFLLMINLTKTNQFADSSIISSNNQINQIFIYKMFGFRQYQGSLFGGYAHTFVLSKFYFS